jgi:hypothetical protein
VYEQEHGQNFQFAQNAFDEERRRLQGKVFSWFWDFAARSLSRYVSMKNQRCCFLAHFPE